MGRRPSQDGKIDHKIQSEKAEKNKKYNEMMEKLRKLKQTYQQKVDVNLRNNASKGGEAADL